MSEGDGKRRLFLVYTEKPLDPEDLQARFTCMPLRPDLALVEWEQSQSRLYHQVKRLIGPDDALFVAALEHQPKFKGMEDGALKWARAWFARNR